MWKVNFIRRFIPNFAETMKFITNNLKKESEIKWISEAKHSFEGIKKAIMEALVIVNPYFTKGIPHIFICLRELYSWCTATEKLGGGRETNNIF